MSDPLNNKTELKMTACQSLSSLQKLTDLSRKQVVLSVISNAACLRKDHFSSFSNGQRWCRYPLSDFAYVWYYRY